MKEGQPAMCSPSIVFTGRKSFKWVASRVPQSPPFFTIQQLIPNDENKLAAHVSINTKVGAVKWNPCNQKEVAYAKVDDCLLPIYNVNTQQTIIAYSTEDPEWTILSDIAFKSDGSSIYACGFGGCRGQIASWDPRQGIKPTSTMITNSWALSSIELYGPNTVVAGGGDGYVYLWDVRRVSSFFYTYPLIPHSVRKKSGYVLKNRREGACQWMIQSIRQNPSCPRQLAVYQKGGGINILDMPGNKFVTTHFHSLPSEGDMAVVNDKVEYKFEEAGPSWLPKYSIYLAPFRDGIRLLDFHPSRDSPLHVDYRGGNQEGYIDIILSKTVVACAAHPFQNVIVAGTQTGSLLLISQSLESIMSEENDETNDETGNGAHTVTKLRSSRIAKRKYS